MPKTSVSSLERKRVIMLFYEPSTRTRFSFEAAVHKLGGTFSSTEDAKQFSSFAKSGESLEDTVRVLSAYADAIVLRHPENGAAVKAARASLIPIINAGDGGNEHPTQAFQDLFTIYECIKNGRLPSRPLRIQFFGDNLKSRTVRSLAKLLATHAKGLNIQIEGMYFGGPEYSPPHRDLLSFLKERNMPYELIGETPGTTSDILYVTRPQLERYQIGKEILGPYPARHRVTRDVAGQTPVQSIIMHPLPRTEELTRDVDADPRAHYFEQSKNGLYVRMALLEWVLTH
jgi:aspartate carbamoyltransferase catalytic subunit